MRQKSTKLALLLLLIATPTIAQANAFIAAHQLLFFCLGPAGTEQEQQCVGFIAGVLDAIDTVNNIQHRKVFCIPYSDNKLGYLKGFVTTYFQTHTPDLQNTAAMLLINGLVET
jgi:hypothetical protein